ncbi:MAG: LCP family protein [Spirochaetales bacterium]|nr:LCP family protein [Spirochaetales bacterium]
MYGDNNNLFLAGIGLILLLFLGSLSLVSLIKIHRLEERLALSSPPAAADTVTDRAASGGESSPEPFREDRSASYGEEEENLAFYRALDMWQEREESRAEAQLLGSELNGEILPVLEELSLTITESSTLYRWTINLKEGKEEIPLFVLTYHDEEWQLLSPGGENYTFRRLGRKGENFLREETTAWLENRERRIEGARFLETLAARSRTTTLLKQKKCRLEKREGDEGLTGFSVVTLSEDRPVLDVSLEEGRLMMDGELFDGDGEEFGESFYQRLSLADTRRESEILLSRGLESIRNLYGDEEFLSTLEERGLYPSHREREDEDFVYLDLKDGEGKVQASFAVKKYTGRVHIMDSNDVPLASLDSLEDSRAILPDSWEEEPYQSRDSFTVLLIGYHNRGTDAMILAHVNRSTRSVSLISIPRDLWWEGQKLNSYFFGNGKEELLSIMSEVSGLQVDHYLAVDMYAFIDVINALGGVDITLEKEVSDPTYRIIREDGTEGTLSYPPGSYHLEGVEALRLVRSRHGSSDFERSLLQQKILSAAKNKAENLSLRDGETFRRFVALASEQTETDMSLTFMVRTFLTVKDYTVEGGHNLNDDNLVYSTYSNYIGLSSAELTKARADEDFARGQWILLPREGDWGVIRGRIRQIIQG